MKFIYIMNFLLNNNLLDIKSKVQLGLYKNSYFCRKNYKKFILIYDLKNLEDRTHETITIGLIYNKLENVNFAKKYYEMAIDNIKENNSES